MRLGIRSLFFAAVLAGALALPAASFAETPITVGTGGTPSVAVDSNGAAHIAWIYAATGGNDDRVMYCRIPHGATSCSPATIFASAGATEGLSPGGRASVMLTTDGRTMIVNNRCCGGVGGSDTRVWTETGVGTDSFSPSTGTSIGTNQAGSHAILDPTGTSIFAISASLTSPDFRVQRMPVTPTAMDPAPTSQASLGSGAGFFQAGSIVFDGSTPVVGYGNTGSPFNYGRYTGSDYNNAGSWTQNSISGVTSPNLAKGGSIGIYAMLRTTSSPSYRAYKYSNSGGAGTFTETGTIAPTDTAITTDLRSNWLTSAGDRLTAFYLRSSDIRCSTSENGSTWTSPATAATDGSGLNLAAAPNGNGSYNWVVWNTGGTSNNGTVRAAEVSSTTCGSGVTVPPETPSTGGTTSDTGGTTSTTTPVTISTPTTSKKSVCKKPAVIKSGKCVLSKNGLTATGPKDCIKKVKAGATLPVSLSTKAKVRRAKRSVVVKVKRAVFSTTVKLTTGKKKKFSKTVKKAPFKAKILMKNVEKGTYVVKMNAKLKVKKTDPKKNRARNITLKYCVV